MDLNTSNKRNNRRKQIKKNLKKKFKIDPLRNFIFKNGFWS